ncbi:MAG: RNA-binding protein [Deltaproteobacteria bacterium]|nr:RNA-binding protein [Deltaproteobacteria bacterium]
MVKNIYVGNLSFNSDDQELRSWFEQYGTVHSAKVITDRETGRSRGFGFVEMDDEGSDEAIRNLNGADMGGRILKVNEARPREPRPPRRW